MVSLHYLNRAKERARWNQKYAIRQEELAYSRGFHPSDLPGEERKYLEHILKDGKFTRLYNGFIFIYSDDELCLTMFPAPEWFLNRKPAGEVTEFRKNGRAKRSKYVHCAA